ncbi:MAG: hypothetical protein [aquatic viral metagenome]
MVYPKTDIYKGNFIFEEEDWIIFHGKTVKSLQGHYDKVYLKSATKDRIVALLRDVTIIQGTEPNTALVRYSTGAMSSDILGKGEFEVLRTIYIPGTSELEVVVK